MVPRQQARIADGARSAQDSAAHEWIGERYPLSGHQTKVSGSTRSDTGRDFRDAFLSLNKTCAKLRIAFWDYLGARLAVPNQLEVPTLPSIVRHRCASG